MKLTGWGRHPVVEGTALGFHTPAELARRLPQEGSWIPRGLGRAYGDSALAPLVVDCLPARHFLSFDPAAGLLTCQAGVSLHEIIRTFLPRGWFPPVTPGTRQVTVGGAIAADVHGKNHHLAGCFSRHVRGFDLMTPAGELLRCSREENPGVFRATCGGMGLTGVITSATLELMPMQSGLVDQEVVKTSCLGETFQLFEEQAGRTYTVAWVDCLAKGPVLGRGLFISGEHAPEGPLSPPREGGLAAPLELPSGLLNKYTVGLFNRLYHQKQRGRISRSRVGLASFFHPLDSIANWNLIYGKRGFTQYQFVIPRAAGYHGLKEILGIIAGEGLGSFLAVLKLMGPENGNPLSFPLEGYTLALDFGIEPRLFPLLDRLDEIVHGLGGRLYLAKDVRMSPQTLRRGYPRLAEFLETRRRLDPQGRLASRQSRRLEL